MPRIERIKADHSEVMPLEFVKREEWTDHVEKDAEKNVHPLRTVWYTTTCTHPCTDKESCMQRIRGILRVQRDEFKRKDIAYNFLIGGDGRVYEARGWFLTCDLPVHFYTVRHTGVYIAFIGYYTFEEMPKKLYKIADNLVIHGIENNYIERQFVLNDLLTPLPRRFRYERGHFVPGHLGYKN